VDSFEHFKLRFANGRTVTPCHACRLLKPLGGGRLRAKGDQYGKKGVTKLPKHSCARHSSWRVKDVRSSSLIASTVYYSQRRILMWSSTFCSLSPDFIGSLCHCRTQVLVVTPAQPVGRLSIPQGNVPTTSQECSARRCPALGFSMRISRAEYPHSDISIGRLTHGLTYFRFSPDGLATSCCRHFHFQTCNSHLPCTLCSLLRLH